MTPILIILGVLFVICLIIWMIYNGIIGNNNQTKRAWADVLVYERQKIKTLDALKAEADSYKNFEEGALAKIIGLRSQISALPEGADASALAATQSSTQSLMSSLRLSVEAYPELQASKVLNNLMREIAEQQENVAAALSIFNASIETFNNSIQMFPGSLVNNTMNKLKAKESFKDSQASSSFDNQGA